MSTGDRNALNLPGQQVKDTPTRATNQVRMAALRGYLRGLSSLDFTEKGRANVCARHHVNSDELAAAVAALQARPSRPTPELLHAIGRALVPVRKAKEEGAGQC